MLADLTTLNLKNEVILLASAIYAKVKAGSRHTRLACFTLWGNKAL